MKKQILVFLFLLSFVFNAAAQKASETEKNLRTHVAYLASEQLEGRRSGERGATSAAGYVANLFARYKLKTGLNRIDEKGKTVKSYLQSFPYVAGVETGEGNALAVGGAGLNLKTDWMPYGFSPNANFVNSETVFAGFGITAAEAGYDDYAGLDVKNKTVAVFAGAPDGGGPRSPFARFNIHAKAKLAREKGARALIVISNETDLKNDKSAQLAFDQTLGETAVPVVIVSRQTGARLLGASDEKELAALEKWLAGKPAAAQVSFSGLPKQYAALNVNLVKKTVESYNVIGIIEGRDPQLKNEAVVIGAHYDHLGRGGRSSLAPDSNAIHHGADDNASGVAAMLELARRFAKEKNNKRTLIFIAFGGEEDGLLGSKHYVNNPVFPLDKTVAMINMDMVGRLNENKLTVGGIGTASEWKGLIEQKNNLSKTAPTANRSSDKGQYVPVGQVNPKSGSFSLQLNEDGFGPSDHSSFYGKQIPVLFFFTGTHADYHKPTDTAEKINYKGLMEITDFVGEIVTTIDRNPKRPTYTVAQSSGMGEGRRGFNVSLGTVPAYADGDNTGLMLDGVRDDSPAAKAGVKAGDKIVKLAGRDIRNISDYVYVLGEMKPGEEYEIVVVRGGEKLSLKITPVKR
jgi:aminopeptidase YwaD